MIDRQFNLSISQQTKLLGISRGSVYYLPKPIPERDLDIMERLDQLYLKYSFMRTRMLRDQLHVQGVEIGRKRVKTLIPRAQVQRMGIAALYCKPNTSKKAAGP